MIKTTKNPTKNRGRIISKKRAENLFKEKGRGEQKRNENLLQGQKPLPVMKELPRQTKGLKRLLKKPPSSQ